MKFLVELDTDFNDAKDHSEWALWVLKCICAHIKPDGVNVLACQPIPEPEAAS